MKTYDLLITFTQTDGLQKKTKGKKLNGNNFQTYTEAAWTAEMCAVVSPIQVSQSDEAQACTDTTFSLSRFLL